MTDRTNLLSPLTIRGVTLRNRIVMSPMCRGRAAGAVWTGPVSGRGCLRAASATSRGDDPDLPLVEIAGPLPDDDLHVLPECSQQPHEAIGGEVCEATVEQCRHLRLIDAHQPCSGR